MPLWNERDGIAVVTLSDDGKVPLMTCLDLLSEKIKGLIVYVPRPARTEREPLERDRELAEIRKTAREHRMDLTSAIQGAARNRRSDAGFSLIEIMISAGLLAIVALGTIAIQKMGFMGQKTLVAQNDARILTGDMAMILTDSTACANTFQTLNPVIGASVTQVKDKAGGTRYATNSVYGNRAVKLTGITLGGSGADSKTNIQKWTATGTSTGTAFVEVNWTQEGTNGNRGTGPSVLKRYFLVNATLDDSDQITGCTAQAGLSTSASNGSGMANYLALWVSSSELGNSAIYQSGSNVGIGTVDAPVTMIDLGFSGALRFMKHSSEPFSCDEAHDGALAMTSLYSTCVCKNETGWISAIDGSSECIWSTVTIVAYGSGRRWSDNTFAVSCNEYKNPTAPGYQYSGLTGSGNYTIDPDGASGQAEFEVECDMTTANGGWTRLLKGAPTYSHPAWSNAGGYNSISDSSYISRAWYSVKDFTEIYDGARAANISSCWSGKTMQEILALGSSTCAGTAVPGLTTWSTVYVDPSRSHNGCGLKAKLAYGFHTWDGGVSGSWTGIALNGYKTNNSFNCGTSCVIYSPSCLPNTYDGPDGDLWVR